MAGLDSPDTILINVSLDVTHFRVQTFNLGWFGLLNLKNVNLVSLSLNSIYQYMEKPIYVVTAQVFTIL